jgi:lysozyme family protein
MTFLRKWEGGFQNNPEDHGNWTGGRKGVGELKGTKFGISAASYPDLDIVNLTQEQADAIYRRDYWQRSGADKLQWPACLLIFDTAVLHGVGTALNWQKEVGTDAFVLAAKRLRRYTQLDNWSVFGAGWTNRVAALLEEIGRNI